MHVYFVRHGETAENRLHVHQSPNVPLSPRGVEQIRSTAEFLRKVNPDLLLTSEYTRAFESARIVGLATGLTPQTNGLFYELERPSKLFNQSIFSLETLWYAGASVIHRKIPTWHYYDAENYHDIDARARKALAYLESLNGTHQSIIVVSHTICISIIHACMCKKWPPKTRDLFTLFLDSRRMRNGSILHVEYLGTSSPMTCAWREIDTV